MSESFGPWLMAYAAVKRVGAQDRIIFVHTALRYAAGGFAEAKGKYRGSIVESFAVVPIGCRIAQDLNDKARIAGINGSFRRSGSSVLYASIWVCIHRRIALAAGAITPRHHASCFTLAQTQPSPSEGTKSGRGPGDGRAVSRRTASGNPEPTEPLLLARAPPTPVCTKVSIPNVASKGRTSHRFACAPSRAEAACKRPRELSWLPRTAAGRSTPPRETRRATELSILALTSDDRYA
ncbi:hypothetical protein Q7P35_006132 [Cladosporium inversicolor]